jgi:hypothetical protein
VWRSIAQSLQGPSHLAENSPCQDCHSVQVFGEAKEQSLLACIADGAGSARFSDEGSKIACDVIVEHAASHFAAHARFDNLERDDVVRWCDDARERIRFAATGRDCNPRELATTLSAALVSPVRSVFFQIGDGAVVLGQNGLYGVVFWPQSGEYANSTNFLTVEGYAERLEFVSAPTSCTDVALLTDGLERLALRFDNQTPHPPFFDPLFRALRTAGDVARFSEDLLQFLGSESVQQRSDDDKTLILASRITDSNAV